MDSRQMSRRNFSLLTASALGGALAGSLLSSPAGAEGSMSKGMGKDTAHEAMGAKHACCGLNACKGQGADGKNACAGLGSCATVEKHGCAGHNACKGQGGCGEKMGKNACKGKGNCAVPLSPENWEKARAMFEKSMRAAGKAYGYDPKACAHMTKKK